jgi:Na+/melibiose symporter-like transporter
MSKTPTETSDMPTRPVDELNHALGSGPKIWSAGTLRYTRNGLIALFAILLLGDFAWSMRDRSVGPMAQWFLDHQNVPSLVFGLLVSSFPALIGMVLGPVISVKSDRHRGRWGRRIPFLLVTTPIAAAGMIGLGVTPHIAAWGHATFPNESEVLISVLCFGVFWAMFEVATIASQAVFGGLVNDVVPQPLLGRFYGLFRAVSLIDGMIFNYWIMGKVPSHFTVILVGVGVFYGGAFLWVCFRVKEGKYPPPPPPSDKKGLKGAAMGVRTYLRECFSNPYYLCVFLLLMAAQLSFMPVNVFAIPFARSVGVDMDVYGKYLALTFLISLCLSYPLGWMADLFHPLRMAIGTMLGYALVTAWGWAHADSSHYFLQAWVMHGVLSGCYFTSAASLMQRLFPHEKFAQFASAAGMLMAPMSMAIAPVIGSVIDVSGGVYRYTFAGGCVLSILALVAGLVVHARFMKLGGPKNYVAPE